MRDLDQETGRSDPRGAPPPHSLRESLVPGEELVLVRAGLWRLLVPMRHVERIHGAAMPAAIPAETGACNPVVSIAGDLVPLLFCEALLGAGAVTLASSSQMLLLRAASRRALLWVDAAEEVLPFEPLPADAALPELASGFSGRARPYAVLDVPRLLDVALGPAAAGRTLGGTAT